MKLEEILPFVRRGHKPKYSDYEPCDSISEQLYQLYGNDDAILSNNWSWSYVPKRVGWDAAWKALKEGKTIVADYYNRQGSRMERREFRLDLSSQKLEFRQDKHHCWMKYDTQAPLHWFDSANFEILED